MHNDGGGAKLLCQHDIICRMLRDIPQARNCCVRCTFNVTTIGTTAALRASYEYDAISKSSSKQPREVITNCHNYNPYAQILLQFILLVFNVI
jgi:hypothetical protein